MKWRGREAVAQNAKMVKKRTGVEQVDVTLLESTGEGTGLKKKLHTVRNRGQKERVYGSGIRRT